MGDDILSLLFSLFGIVVILFGCYAFSKYAAKKINTFSDSQNIKILEKVPLAQDKGLALAKICGKYYLIGFSGQSVELLKELPEDDLEKREETGPAASFLNVLQQVRKNGWSVKSFEQDRRAAEDDWRNGEEQNDKTKKP